MKISSHNEWDRLKEIVVGSAAGSRGVLTWNRPDPIPPEVMNKAAEIAAKAYPTWFLDEVEEDLDNLASTIASFGVKVHRPNVHDIQTTFSTPFGIRLGTISTM